MKHALVSSLPLTALLLILLLEGCGHNRKIFESEPLEVDYVDVYQGTGEAFSATETPPIIQLPNSLLRIMPYKESLRAARIKGLPLYTPQGEELPQLFFTPHTPATPVSDNTLSFDFQDITPYSYHIYLDELQYNVDYTLSSHCGLYTLTPGGAGKHPMEEFKLSMRNSERGTPQWEQMGRDGIAVEVPWSGPSHTHTYLYLQFNSEISSLTPCDTSSTASYQSIIVRLRSHSRRTVLKYGISLISREQAQRNLLTQIQSFDHAPQCKAARNEWQKVLRRIQVSGGTEVNLRKFYTALYRTHLWPTLISEEGRYYSPIDDSVHSDEGIPQYYQDNLRLSHETQLPLMMLINPEVIKGLIASYLRELQHTKGQLFESLDLHGVNYTDQSSLLYLLTDAQAKGLLDLNIRQAFESLQQSINMHQELHKGYDRWCMSQLANFLGHTYLADQYSSESKQYPASPGRLTAQQLQKILESKSEAPLLIPEDQINIDSLFSVSHRSFNVTPDLFAFLFAYNLMGRPHDTQKFVRHVIDHYFSLGTFSYPGPDPHGSLSAALVFAMVGLYPIAPGLNGYTIGAPIFNEISINMGGGRHLKIKAQGASAVNKYITDLTLGGRPYRLYWIKHSRLAQGGELSMRLSEIGS